MSALIDYREALATLARPAPLPGGIEPEARVVLGGIGWQGHLELDAAFGHDRSGPRFYYLDGDLEIMSTSREHERISEHERIKKCIGNCIDDYLLKVEMPNLPVGQATMHLEGEAGAEPDESWCLREEKEYPDLVLEIALTSGGLPKLEIYQRFGVPEVWMWRRGRLEIYALRAVGEGYERIAGSRLLPGLPVAAIEAAVAEPDVLKARRDLRAAL